MKTTSPAKPTSLKNSTPSRTPEQYNRLPHFFDGVRKYDDVQLDFEQILWRSPLGHIVGINASGEFLIDEPQHFDDAGKDKRTYVHQRHRRIATREAALHTILCFGVPNEFRTLLDPLLDQLEIKY